MKKFLTWKIALILIFSAFLTFFDLPASTQSKMISFTPKAILDQNINLGLDLQGGSQLDYKIDLRKVPEDEQDSIISGVLNVIEKRVNSLGVSEPNIYTSEIADETHIIVEIAENTLFDQEDVENYLHSDKSIDELTDDEIKKISLEKAKATVGKTIQLEFKEEKTTIDPQEKEEIKENAQLALNKITEGEDFAIVGKEEEQAYPGKVSYQETEYVFESDLFGNIKEQLESLEIGQYTKELVETSQGYSLDQNTGDFVENTALAIIRLVDKTEEKRYDKTVETSHILISYQGAEGADASITKTEEEAYTIAKELLEKLNTEEEADFATIAKENSDDTETKEEGGKIAEAITPNSLEASEYVEASLALEEGQLSEIIKTNEGYHIIKADKVNSDVMETQYKYQMISFSTVADPWKETGLTGEHFVHADIGLNDLMQAYVTVQFNEEGAKLFEEITERNVNKKLAIFVGGEFISSPTVNEKIVGGSAIISGNFTNDEATALARDLNTGAIPAPIILTGEYTIGATLGHDALNKSLKGGLIGLLIIMVFMILFYRIPGLIASFALFTYSVLLIFLIKSGLHMGLALAISVIIFLFLILKITNNEDSAWEKFLSFILSCAALFFLIFLLKTPITLTLAGVAGIILSIGMAVDANILIFERIKEELRNGKTLKIAIDSGFARAWSAIRDSNFSTLITCAILFYFGSSIIRGFAFNLAAGILVSMFTAITITRTLLYSFVGRKIAQNLKAFGVCEKRKKRKFNFIKLTKVWLGISGTLVAIAVIAMFSFGFKLGIDFTGGSLMEIHFSEDVSKENLEQKLQEIELKINEELASKTETTEASTTDELSIQNTEDASIDLTNIQILSSNENFIIKTKYLDNTNHDKIITELETAFGELNETRFTAIGPTIGKTLLQKALKAIIFTLIVIIFYLAIAFRKITKQVSSWRFGLAAIIALLHDVIIVTGFFLILSQFLNVEIDALFITAMLTVFGYSVNDTIVVFDRLRENLLKGRGKSIEENANLALNETMTRSLNTSLSTLIALTSILLMGSSSIFFFILALTAGTVIGTYSSIFLASPLLVLWSSKKGSKK